MNLVEQIFQQAQAGSANGQGFGSSFAEGVQAGQRQQQLDIRKRELAMELAQAPLKQTLLQQKVEAQALELEGGLAANQQRIEGMRAFNNLDKEVGMALSEAEPIDALTLAIRAGTRDRALYSDPRYSAMVKQLEALTQEAARIEQYTARSTYAPSNAQKNFDQTRALQQALDDANASGNPDAIAKAKRDLDTFGAMTTPPTQTVYDPKTGNPIFTSGRSTSDLTTGTRTRLQEQEMSDSEAIRTLRDAIGGIEANPNAIGVRGVVGSALEKARGQLSPGEAMDTPITDTRQKASIAFSRVAPALRVDSGNMSKYELNKLEQAGDVLDPREAPQTALTKLRNLQAVVVARQLRVLKAQGKAIDDATLSAVRGEEIAGLLQSGLLSQEDALRLYRLHKNAR